MARPRLRVNRLPVAPPPLRHRVHSPSSAPREGSLDRVRRLAREHRRAEGPAFDPEKRGTWRGSSRDLVVNPPRARRGDKHGRETDEEFVVIENEDSNDPGFILVNPLDYPQYRGDFFHRGDAMQRSELFALQFGAYGWTKLLVWARSAETALEEASGWLETYAPGIFVDQEELRSLEKEYREEHPDADDDDVMGEAYADLTYTEAGYIPSHEWTLDDVSRGEMFECALDASKKEYERVYDEEAP